jgi:hypothetical protein
VVWNLIPALLLAAPPGAPAKAPPAANDLAAPVRLEAGGKPIDVDIGHAAPCVADIDGKPCLLVGQFGEGKVRVFANVGTKQKPKFDKFEWLHAGGKIAQVPTG